MIDLVPIKRAHPSVFFPIVSGLTGSRQCVCFVGYGTMAPWNAEDEHYGLLFTLALDR